MTSTELAIRDPRALDLPNDVEVETRLQEIAAFQKLVQRSLRVGLDYGPPYPGATKNTLLLPGAQKIVKLLRCTPKYRILKETTDWESGLHAFTILCTLVSMRDGITEWSEGVGECNTNESKYRYRKGERECPECGKENIRKSKQDGGWYCWVNTGGCGATFGLNNPEIVDQDVSKVANLDRADQRNTVLKVGKKRALVDAALDAANMSDVMTQDIGDPEDDFDGPVIEGTARVVDRGTGEIKDPPVTRTRTRRAPPRQSGSSGAPVRKDVVVADDIKNAGHFMIYVNGRWPGHNQAAVCSCLNIEAVSEIKMDKAGVGEAIEALAKFWGPGQGADAEEIPVTVPVDDTGGGDVSIADGEGVGTEATTA